MSQKIFLYTLILLFSKNIALCQYFEGQTTDRQTGEPLSYVNIGVIGKHAGTCSDLSGNFYLKLPENSDLDTVRVSMIGYKSQYFHINSAKDRYLKVELDQDTSYLSDVIVSSFHSKELIIGSKSSSKKIVTGWGKGFGMGGERGIKIKVSGSYYLKQFNFHMAVNHYDSVLFRLHVRNIENEMPSKEFLKENIFIPVKVESGWVSVDLEPYDLIVEEDVVISLEWVNAWGKCEDEYCLEFSLNMIKGTMYAKSTSDNHWIVKKSMSPGFHVIVSN